MRIYNFNKLSNTINESLANYITVLLFKECINNNNIVFIDSLVNQEDEFILSFYSDRKHYIETYLVTVENDNININRLKCKKAHEDFEITLKELIAGISEGMEKGDMLEYTQNELKEIIKDNL